VPIVPNLVEAFHWQWEAFDGFTFAIRDYLDVGMMQHLNDPELVEGMKLIDPAYYLERLNTIPKLVVVSSDDEFMMMDWTQLWYDNFQGGETHLMITPNAEHSMLTNIWSVLSSCSAFIKSVASGKPREVRPKFTYTQSNSTGELVVTVPAGGPQPTGVYLRHGQTMQNIRRDFRWVRAANNFTQPCTFPFIPFPDGKDLFGGNCAQLIFWEKTELLESAPGVFRATPPNPTRGFWTGYYIMLTFDDDTPGTETYLPNQFELTTPGFTWPMDLPFPPCVEDGCLSRIV
jgi:hypothetical protein